MDYPTSFQAVDNVILSSIGYSTDVLLGRKEGKTLWQFPGGFVDPADESLEEAAARERREEVGINLECSKPEYLFSFRVKRDKRYIDSPHKIMSAVFVSYRLFGFDEAGDDLKETMWYDLNLLFNDYKKIIVEEHHLLVETLSKKKFLLPKQNPANLDINLQYNE